MISRFVLGISLVLLPQIAHSQPVPAAVPVCEAGYEISIDINRTSPGFSNFGEVPSIDSLVRASRQARVACKALGTQLGDHGLVPRLMDSSLQVDYQTPRRSVDLTVLPTDPKARAKLIARQWPARFKLTGSAHYCCIDNNLER